MSAKALPAGCFERAAEQAAAEFVSFHCRGVIWPALPAEEWDFAATLRLPDAQDESHARLALHARAISFKHPFSGKQLIFSAKVPGHFSKLIGNIPDEDGPGSCP